MATGDPTTFKDEYPWGHVSGKVFTWEGHDITAEDLDRITANEKSKDEAYWTHRIEACNKKELDALLKAVLLYLQGGK